MSSNFGLGDTMLSTAYKKRHWQEFQNVLEQSYDGLNKSNLWIYLMDAVDKSYFEPIKTLSRFCNSTELSEALIIACLAGNKLLVDWLVTKTSANVHFCNSDGMTPLSAAIRMNYWEVINYLIVNANVIPNERELRQCMRLAVGEDCSGKMQVLVRFCDVNLLNECLIISSLFGYINLVRWLLCNTQANYYCKDNLGLTPFTAACNQGHWDIVKYFVNEGYLNVSHAETWAYLLAIAGKDIPEVSISIIIEFSSKDQRNKALVSACKTDRLEVVKLLITKGGADYNSKDLNDALVTVCWLGQLSFVDWLVTNTSASVHYCNSNGMTPLSAAISMNHWDIIIYLIVNNYVIPNEFELRHCMRLAAEEGCVDKVKVLVRFCDSNLVNMCLITSCLFGHLNLVRWLLDNTQAYYHYKDNFGNTSFTAACKQGHWDVVKYFIEVGFLDLSDSDTWANLLAVAGKEIPEVSISVIMEFSAMDQRNESLVQACRNGQLKLVELLVFKGGANVNIEDDWGYTPLTAAIEACNWDIVSYLVKTPTFVPDKHDISQILTEAVNNDSTEEFERLAAFVKTSELNDFLYDACKYGQLEVVNWLLANSDVDVNYVQETEDMSFDSDSDSEIFTWPFRERNTTVSIACKEGYWDVVKSLINSPRFDDDEHDIPKLLLAATKDEQEEEIKFFAQHCFDDETLNEAFIIACKRGNLSVVQWFMSSNNSIDVNYHSDMSGETCLTIACDQDNWSIVKYLIQQSGFDRDEHKLCEYIFELADEGNFDEDCLEKAYLQAKALNELYDSDGDADMWESWSDPEQ